jgi:hypothetical protein
MERITIEIEKKNGHVYGLERMENCGRWCITDDGEPIGTVESQHVGGYLLALDIVSDELADKLTLAAVALI